MPVSFSEFSEALLLERKFDQEMGQAAEKSFNMFGEILTDAIEKMGAYFIKVLQKVDEGLSYYERNLRNDIYVHTGRGYLVPNGSYNASDYDARLLLLDVERLMQRAMNETLKDVVTLQSSKIIGSNRSTIEFLPNTDIIVLPKSISLKQLSGIFSVGPAPGIMIRLHSSRNVQMSSTTDTAVGAYTTPNPLPTVKFDTARIDIGGFSCFDPEAVSPLVSYLVQNMGKPNLMRKAIKDWVALADKNLRERIDTYIHEYIHFLDDIRMAGVKPKNVTAGIEAGWSSQGDKAVYYKSDIEWNAHFNTTATIARAAMRDFMICVPNKGVALAALGEDKMDEVGDTYVVKKPYKAAWNGLIANKIEMILIRTLKEMAGNRIKNYVDLTQRPNYPEKNEAQKMLNIFVSQSKTTIGLMFLYVFNLFLGSGGTFTDFMMKDEKFRKKFYTRIYSVAEDLKKIFDDGIANVKAGKFPSKQAWNSAIKNFHSIPASQLKAVRMSKFWSDTVYANPAHMELYIGSFMKSFTDVNGPFDPNKPISKRLEGFKGI